MSARQCPHCQLWGGHAEDCPDAKLHEDGPTRVAQSHREQPPPRPQARLHVHIVLKAFNIIDDAVMRGVEYGVQRSFKHTDSPSREHIIEQVQRAVISELCEVLDFDGPKERVE